MRAPSVSNMTPTDTGNPPDAVIRRLIGILEINTDKDREN